MNVKNDIENIEKKVYLNIIKTKVGWPFLSSSQLKPLVRLTTDGQSAVQCSLISYTFFRFLEWTIAKQEKLILAIFR